MITYENTKKDNYFYVTVKLDDKPVGEIRKEEHGWRFYLDGQEDGEKLYSTLERCKASLDNRPITSPEKKDEWKYIVYLLTEEDDIETEADEEIKYLNKGDRFWPEEYFDCQDDDDRREGYEVTHKVIDYKHKAWSLYIKK